MELTSELIRMLRCYHIFQRVISMLNKLILQAFSLACDAVLCLFLVLVL